MNKLASVILEDPDTGERVQLVGEVAGQYKAELKRHYSAECNHLHIELRKRTVSGGGIQCRPQCLTCGAAVGNAQKKQDGLPDWNQALEASYTQTRSDEYASIRRTFIGLYVDETKRLNEKSKNWQVEYAAYRRTPAWQVKRARVLRRANGVCEGCLDAKATVVHHTVYTHMGDELLYQLIALCSACHKKAHPEHHESFYDIDYIPCKQCRWGDGGITCGKFGVPAYEALEAGGPCGPGGSEFEEFR